MASVTFLLLPFLALIKIAASLLGLVVVAVALPFAKEDTPPQLPNTVSRTTSPDWHYVRLPLWANWIWGNDKYGAEGNWFWEGKTFWGRYVWLALRNPANNLQRYSWFRFDTEPGKVKYHGSLTVNDVAGLAGQQLVWQDWRAGFYWIHPWSSSRCLRVRLGYKIDPVSNNPTSASLSILINPFANFNR